MGDGQHGGWAAWGMGSMGDGQHGGGGGASQHGHGDVLPVGQLCLDGVADRRPQHLVVVIGHDDHHCPGRLGLQDLLHEGRTEPGRRRRVPTHLGSRAKTSKARPARDQWSRAKGEGVCHTHTRTRATLPRVCHTHTRTRATLPRIAAALLSGRSASGGTAYIGPPPTHRCLSLRCPLHGPLARQAATGRDRPRQAVLCSTAPTCVGGGE